MDIRIEYGGYSDLDHIEQLYDDLNDVLESRVNYQGWKKGIYPMRNDALAGIQEHLMKFAEEFGLQNNIKAIRLDVYEKNEPAIQLYEHCGYQHVGTVDLGLACHGLEWFKLYEKLL